MLHLGWDTLYVQNVYREHNADDVSWPSSQICIRLLQSPVSTHRTIPSFGLVLLTLRLPNSVLVEYYQFV
jgi:hypothetical protein